MWVAFYGVWMCDSACWAHAAGASKNNGGKGHKGARKRAACGSRCREAAQALTSFASFAALIASFASLPQPYFARKPVLFFESGAPWFHFFSPFVLGFRFGPCVHGREID